MDPNPCCVVKIVVYVMMKQPYLLLVQAGRALDTTGIVLLYIISKSIMQNNISICISIEV